MIPISALNEIELAAVNQARYEDGKPPLGSSLGRVQVSAGSPLLQTITSQDFAPPASGSRKFQIEIKDLSSTEPPPPGTTPQTEPGAPRPGAEPPRWTTPSEPSQPSSFAQSVTATIARRLGKRLRIKPQAESVRAPQSFAEAVAKEIRRRTGCHRES
jgi:hypothetical protein